MRATDSPRSRAPGDELGQQRVVVDRHLGARRDARVDAHAGPLGHRPGEDAAGRRQVVALGILGVEAALEGVAPAPRSRPARRAAAGPRATSICRRTRSRPVTALGHRVLDLQARVHLEEVEGARRRRAGTRRCPRSRSRRPRAAATPAAHRRRALLRRRARGSASPRPPSGGAAGSSTRARRGGASVPVARRPGPAPRRGAAARRSARGPSTSSPKAAQRLAPRGRRARPRTPRAGARRACPCRRRRARA